MSRHIKADPNTWYNLVDIVEQRLFPWCKDIKTVRRMIRKDRESENVLNTVMFGFGRGTKYRIKGENIIKFIAKIEQGKYRLY